MPVTSHPRRARRSALVVCSGLLLALATSASASAAVQYGVSSYDGGASYGGSVNGPASGTPDELTGPVRIVVSRAGSVMAQATGTYAVDTPDGQPPAAHSSADTSFNARAGDTVQLFYPASDTTPVRSTTIGGLTIASCAVGASSFTGKRDGVPTGLSSDYAGGFRASGSPGDPGQDNPGTISGGADYTATLERPLGSYDLVYFGSTRHPDTDFAVSREIDRTVSECAPKPEPQPQPAAPVVVIPPVFNGILYPLTKPGVEQRSDPFVILVAINCSTLSKLPCSGKLTATTPRRFATSSAANASPAAAKKAALQLARKSFSVAPGEAKIVKLKLTKQGQRLLKRQRTLAIRVSSVARDAKTGVSRTTSRTIKLKAKKAGKTK